MKNILPLTKVHRYHMSFGVRENILAGATALVGDSFTPPSFSETCRRTHANADKTKFKIKTSRLQE
jgi:hypothetical protein